MAAFPAAAPGTPGPQPTWRREGRVGRDEMQSSSLPRPVRFPRHTPVPQFVFSREFWK